MNMQIELVNLIMRIQKKQGCKLFVSRKKENWKKSRDRQMNRQQK